LPFFDALKDAVAAQQEQIQALSAHLIAQTPPKPKARPKAKAATFADVQAEMLRARGTHPDSGSALHSVGLIL
jgi:hypothetical protein